MGYPSYPSLRGNVSGILEIPVFPVAPELFFQDKNNKLVDIERYYFNAIDEMVKLNIPVIMYAHTSVEYREVPRLLERITEYALGVKGLKGKNMTDIHDSWTNLSDSEKSFSNKDKSEVQQNLDFFGKPAKVSMGRKTKDAIKRFIDYEKLTPDKELLCDQPRKMLKLLARKVL